MFPWISMGALVGLAGCAARPEAGDAGGISFADASAEQRVIAARAALGHGPALALQALRAAEADAAGGCPGAYTVSEEPLHRRYVGDGCAASSGIAYAGGAETWNLPAGDEAGSGSPGVADLYSFAVDFGSGESWVFAGFLEQSRWDGGEEYTAGSDLQVRLGEVEFAARSVWDCAAEVCRIQPASAGEVAGLGEFAISGEIGPDGGWIELAGRDALAVELGDVDTGGCFAATIDGESVEALCIPEKDP